MGSTPIGGTNFMIISSFDQLEVGKVYKGGPFHYMSDDNAEWRNDFTFLVLRIATLEEYIEYVKLHGNQPFRPFKKEVYCYEVSMD